MQAGLPGGRVIYTDTRAWGKLEKPLVAEDIGLVGKPDYLVQSGEAIIPVEVKSGRPPATPYDSHIFQLAAYCMLVHKNFGKRPPYGILHYAGRDFAIDYTRELESSLLDLLLASAEGRGLGTLPPPQWRSGAALTTVVAVRSYSRASGLMRWESAMWGATLARPSASFISWTGFA